MPLGVHPRLWVENVGPGLVVQDPNLLALLAIVWEGVPLRANGVRWEWTFIVEELAQKCLLEVSCVPACLVEGLSHESSVHGGLWLHDHNSCVDGVVALVVGCEAVLANVWAEWLIWIWDEIVFADLIGCVVEDLVDVLDRNGVAVEVGDSLEVELTPHLQLGEHVLQTSWHTRHDWLKGSKCKLTHHGARGLENLSLLLRHEGSDEDGHWVLLHRLASRAPKQTIYDLLCSRKVWIEHGRIATGVEGRICLVAGSPVIVWWEVAQRIEVELNRHMVIEVCLVEPFVRVVRRLLLVAVYFAIAQQILDIVSCLLRNRGLRHCEDDQKQGDGDQDVDVYPGVESSDHLFLSYCDETPSPKFLKNLY